MKRLVSLILVLCMAFAALSALAAGPAEDVLLKVKSKIDIPEGLTEFNYNESTYDNVLRYDFTWHDKDYGKEVYVTTDSLGRIITYNYYESMDYSADKSLIGYTLSDAESLADAFVKKAYPEYFENSTDTLVLKKENKMASYSGRYKTFTFVYERYHDDEVMVSNNVNVRVRATKEKIYVQSASAALDEDVTFNSGDIKEIGEKEYTDKFPIELFYMSDYSGEEKSVKLFYSMDRGFVSRITGEVVTQKHFDRYADYGAAEDSVMMESTTATGGVTNKNNALTPEEITALEEMAALVKVEEVAEKLRNIEILGIKSDMKVETTSTNKYDDEYRVHFSLGNEYQTTNVSYKGETGEIISVYTYIRTDKLPEKKTSDSGSVMPVAGVENLVRDLSGDKLDETEIKYSENGETQKYGTMTATRLVNGIPYPENAINVTYDMEHNMVTRYNITWDKDVTSFPMPDKAMSLEKATEVIFGIAPVYNVLVKTQEGYTPVITVSEAVLIDAITGTELYIDNRVKAEYTDIDSHWAKKEIEVLWEHDIYLDGDKFKPDEAITQADMIKLFVACRDAGIVSIGWTKERIAQYGAENGYVDVAEPDKLMTRKEAFDALINILGYGEIASYDIYKSSYTDMEACGSAEILKAMGVLVGDIARADDYLTHAEAAVMVYRYLNK